MDKSFPLSPMAMLGEVLQPDMLAKLRTLDWFRDYEAEVKTNADADAEVRAEARVQARIDAAHREAEAALEAALAKMTLAATEVLAARAEAKSAAEATKAAANALGEALTDFVVERGDRLSEYSLKKISDCSSPRILSVWLKRAHHGETAEDIFPEPEEGQSR